MIRKSLQPHKIDAKALVKSTARESDTGEVISETGIYTDEQDRPLIIYGRFEEHCHEMEWAMKTLKYHTGERTLGLKSTSQTFGFHPRLTIRRDFCRACALSTNDPKRHGIICEFGKKLASVYSVHSPEVYAKHMEALKVVRPEWVIPGTPFTSGILNKDNSLKYHFDTGNFPGVMSCMVVFRRDIDGGYLSVPEYGVRFLLQDRSYFLFDGQNILHGVTAIRKMTSMAYRYSAVYYALRQMGHCGSAAEELERIRQVKRKREWKRLEYQS